LGEAKNKDLNVKYMNFFAGEGHSPFKPKKMYYCGEKSVPWMDVRRLRFHFFLFKVIS